MDNIKKIYLIAFIGPYLISIGTLILGIIHLVNASNYKQEGEASPLNWIGSADDYMVSSIMGMMYLLITTLLILFGLHMHISYLIYNRNNHEH